MLESLPALQEQLRAFFSVNSMGSVAARALLWFVVAIIIIASTDTGGSRNSEKNIRSNIGLFLFFLVLCGGLIYLLFGFVPVV